MSGAFLPVIGEVEAIDPAGRATRRGVQRQGLFSTWCWHDANAKSATLPLCASNSSTRSRTTTFKRELDRFPNAKELLWVQEEPKNQGAWYWLQHYLSDLMLPGQTLRSASRPSSASAGRRLSGRAPCPAAGAGG